MKSRLQKALRAAARRKRGRRAIGFGVIFTFGLLVVALAADAQPPGKISRIGYLGLAAPTPEVLHLVEALRQGLRELGYVEGRNIAIEYRWAEGSNNQSAAGDFGVRGICEGRGPHLVWAEHTRPIPPRGQLRG